MSIRNKQTPRIRRSPEESRANILSAAEALLLEHGPQSLRLADVAKAAGVANATVLHHFGSIGAVHTALMERMIADLVDSLMAIDIPADAPVEARAVGLKTLFDALETPGAARLAAWLELTDETSRLTVVREAVQEVAQKKIASAGVPEDLAEDMILLSVTLALGVGLFGPSLGRLIGKPERRARELTLQMLLANFERLAG
ncbi:MAG: TetR/AcrR family transcriptional regulator [Hyphomonas sp.]|uniref:TetR/AcrR family transcriptional regulator n=1 Tax=Hyphomonas sp. TaxID=87 RepID=UPI00352844C7